MILFISFALLTTACLSLQVMTVLDIYQDKQTGWICKAAIDLIIQTCMSIMSTSRRQDNKAIFTYIVRISQMVYVIFRSAVFKIAFNRQVVLSTMSIGWLVG